MNLTDAEMRALVRLGYSLALTDMGRKVDPIAAKNARFRWFFCAGNGCQNIEWRAQDGRSGVIAFREGLGPALGRPKG